MTDLNKLLGIDERKSFALSQLISETRKMHPADRMHFIAHLEGKLEDPEHKACIPDLEALCAMVLVNFTVDQVLMLIEEIAPTTEEMAMLQFMAALQGLLGGGFKQ